MIPHAILYSAREGDLRGRGRERQSRTAFLSRSVALGLSLERGGCGCTDIEDIRSSKRKHHVATNLVRGMTSRSIQDADGDTHEGQRLHAICRL